MVNFIFLLKIIKYPAGYRISGKSAGYPANPPDIRQKKQIPNIQQKSISGQIISGHRISGPSLLFLLVFDSVIPPTECPQKIWLGISNQVWYTKMFL